MNQIELGLGSPPPKGHLATSCWQRARPRCGFGPAPSKSATRACRRDWGGIKHHVYVNVCQYDVNMYVIFLYIDMIWYDLIWYDMIWYIFLHIYNANQRELWHVMAIWDLFPSESHDLFRGAAESPGIHWCFSSPSETHMKQLPSGYD